MSERSLGENYTSITTFHAQAVTEKSSYITIVIFDRVRTHQNNEKEKKKQKTLTPNKWSNLQEYLYEIALDGEISDETDFTLIMLDDHFQFKLDA